MIIVDGEILLPAPFIIVRPFPISARFLVVIILVVELVVAVLVPVIVITAAAPRAPIRAVLVLLVRSRFLRCRHVDVEEHRPRVSVVVDHIRHEDLQVQAGNEGKGMSSRRENEST